MKSKSQKTKTNKSINIDTDTKTNTNIKTKSKALEMDSFFQWDNDTLVLNVLGTPSASKDAIGKVKGNQLRISVTEAPRKGRATDHMVRFLANEFEVSISDIEVVFGRFNVNKQLRIKSPKKLPRVFSKSE